MNILHTIIDRPGNIPLTQHTQEQTMTVEEAVQALDAIQPDADPKYRGDPQEAHARADQVLMEFVGPDVAAAYDRVVTRLGAWWYA